MKAFLEHNFLFSAALILAKSECFWGPLISEAVEIQLDGNTINHDISLHLSTAWRPAIDLLKNE